MDQDIFTYGRVCRQPSLYLFYSNRSIMGRIITFKTSVKVLMVRKAYITLQVILWLRGVYNFSQVQLKEELLS